MPLDGLLARTGFNVPNQDDIDGLALDGDDVPAAAIGTFAKHPTSESTIAVRSSHATGLGTGDVDKYTIADITGLDAVEHAAEAVLRFPSFDTVTPGGPCQAGDCAGQNPARCQDSGAEGAWLDYYWIWFQRPPLGTTAHASVQCTTPTGTYAKGEVDINADGSGAFYITVTRSGADAGLPTIGPHALHFTFGMHDFCNGLGIDILQGGGGTNVLGVSYTAGNSPGAPYGGGIGTGTHASDLGTAPSHSATGLTLNAYDSGGLVADEGDEVAFPEVTVRSDPTDDTNYGLTIAFRHDLGPDISSELQLYERVTGSQRLLKSFVVTALHETPTALKLEAYSTHVLRALWGGVEQFTFNLTTDLAEEDGLPAALIASGRPGLTATVVNPDWLAIEQVSVYGQSIPCNGPPDNPYPHEPPPIPPVPLARIVWKNGAWRTCPDVWEWRGGAFRKALGPELEIEQAVWAEGAFRDLTSFDGDTIPEPNTPEPPFYDPCNELPPITGGPLVPLTSRFWGMSNAPLSVCGPLFTGTQIATGYWTASDLAASQAKGVTLVSAQGGSNGIKLPGDYWDLGTFIDGTIAKLTPVYATLVAYAALGVYFGYSMMDDFESKSLWRPNGVPIAEMIAALNTLRAIFPGIRWGLRAKPSQFSSNPGFDFYSAQFKSELGSPFAFGATEYALAAARGAYVMLDLNFLHGGDGSSGIRYFNGTLLGQSAHNWFCSPAEVAYYFEQMYLGAQSVDVNVPNLAGSKGYQFYPPFIDQVGMTDAMTDARNALAALPPLP